MKRAHVTSSRILLAGACTVALLLVACSGDEAFESNDYFMDYLTTVPLGKQIESASGRASGGASKAVLQGGVEARTNARIEDAIEQAEAAQAAGDPALAADLLDEAIRSRPNDVALLGDRADVAIQLGDPETAQTRWEQQDRAAENLGWTEKAWYWEEMIAEANATVDTAVKGSDLESGGDLIAASFRRHAELLEGAAFYAASQGNDEQVVEYEELARQSLADADEWEEIYRETPESP